MNKISDNGRCYRLTCVSPKDINVLTAVPVTMTIFVNRIFADKLKTGVFIKRDSLDTKTRTEGRHVKKHREKAVVSKPQGTPEATGS